MKNKNKIKQRIHNRREMQRNKSKAWNNADRLYYQFGEYLL